MDKIESEIKKINLKIDEIELLLEKDFEEWTLKEIQKFGNHEQLRKEEEQLRKKKEQLRDLLILKEKEKEQPKLPKLGDAESMYDVFGRLSSKSHTMPSYYKTNKICEFTEEDIVPPLSQQEREAILDHENTLWRHAFDGLMESVPVGLTEATIDHYVGLVIESVADALKLKMRLEQQSFINSKRADHWVVSLNQGCIVGCNENKLPHIIYQEPYVTNKNEFLVQIYNQMTEVFNYYGTVPVFCIGSTGREWRFFKLPHDDYDEATLLSLEKPESIKHDDYRALTWNMGPIQYDNDDEMEVDQEDGEIQVEEKMKLAGTKVYKWNDQEMLFMLGSVLKQMALSKMTQISIVTEDSIRNRVTWHLIKADTVLPWGWAKFSVPKLHWRSMISKRTSSIVILGMLGKGADGKVVLVANKKGQVAAMKLLKVEKTAKKEARNWTEIYSNYCKQYNWSIRSEKWMGIPTVIMPVLNQFMTKEERLDNLDGVKQCLELFFAKGYLHDDIYWRNIGYFKAKGEIVIILLDLHPTRVFKQENDGAWIEQAIERLKKRAGVLPQSESNIL